MLEQPDFTNKHDSLITALQRMPDGFQIGAMIDRVNRQLCKLENDAYIEAAEVYDVNPDATEEDELITRQAILGGATIRCSAQDVRLLLEAYAMFLQPLVK